MHKKVEQTIADIKALKIQGARNVAKAALLALAAQAEHSNQRTAGSFYAELEKTTKVLSEARPTEPMTRNSLRMVMDYTDSNPADVRLLKHAIKKKVWQMLTQFEEEAEKLSDYGARLIPKHALVITHCHSSTVTRILKKARKQNIEVIACETRPRWQGRITAKELAQAGVNVSLIVDGAANMFMKKADIVLVGADAVTSRGDLINKVGTSMLAHIAKLHDVSFYSAAELLKYSPMTVFGVMERIEQRASEEVWEKPAAKVKIQNPAFDVTAANYLAGYVTEEGVIPPQSFFTFANEKLNSG